MHYLLFSLFLFFFTNTPTTEIYTLSLHDALPIFAASKGRYLALVNSDVKVLQDCLSRLVEFCEQHPEAGMIGPHVDRKSTRLNSSHRCISYAVFCLKKKKKIKSKYSRNKTTKTAG